MKIDVINPTTEELIETYSIRDFSILDFHQWKNESEIVIRLSCLLDELRDLDSIDPETNEPISNQRRVDFYLSNPIIDQVFSQFEKLTTNNVQEESNTQYSDSNGEVIERISTPKLKSSTVLSAVVTEILQNHSQPDYEVRISDD